MRNRRLSTLPRLALFTAAATLSLAALLPLSASARSTAFPTAEVVNVGVNFSTQQPLPDLRQETLATSQKDGRKFLYRLARDECAILKAVIAKSCRLTNINISTQIQHHNNQNPMLYINGNANFTIELKGDELE